MFLRLLRPGESVIQRPHRWTKSAIFLSAILSACGDDSSPRTTTDAAANHDGTADSAAAPHDATTDQTQPIPDAATDRVAPSDAAPPETAASDVAYIDTGAQDTGPQAEASCAVDAGPLDDAEVALGQSIVMSHRCTTCHGGTLSGNYDGVMSPTLEGGRAYPPNLTSDPATGLGCWTNEQIENAILNGIDNEGTALCPPMPRWAYLTDGGALDAAQAQAVVAFLRSLPIFVNQVPETPDCPAPDAAPPIDAGSDTSDDAPESGAEAAAD